MKRLLLLLTLFALTITLHAQLPWKLKLGSKTILQTKTEDLQKNKVKIRLSQISSSTTLTVSYPLQADEKEWNRNIMVDDSTGAGILIDPPRIRKGSSTGSFTISGKKLKEILSKHKKIQLFYTSIPSDPEKAMLVRVRKVHIATISL